MKQILQSLKTGTTEIVETPLPHLKPGHVLIQTTRSLISPGTEKMLVEFGKASLIEKVRQQPDKVRMVLDKVKTDGVLPTVEAVQHKLDQKLPMGYCQVGTVLQLADPATPFAIGDRVISNGPHAEVVAVAKNLCCKIPDAVSDDEAAFTVLGAIALQGIRLAQPTLGESFVVIGLGLIGLLTVQLLRAQGCRVLGIDFDAKKLALAAEWGASTANPQQGDDILAIAKTFSRHRGVDGVLITASTQSNDPIHQAAQMCRKRGRIILVGVTGLALSRADFYEKELSFQVSCSYGPGRYDPIYEEHGHDYPLGFVRWTEQRNFEAVLDLLAAKTLNVMPLITHDFLFAEAAQAYALLSSGENALGILLRYPEESIPTENQDAINRARTAKTIPAMIQLNAPKAIGGASVTIGFIGAGNYASRILIPAFAQTTAVLKTIACNNGISGVQSGKKFGFEQVTTNTQDILADPTINTVVIATRHDSHAEFVLQALQQQKQVFVEKPLCLQFSELDAIVQTLSQATAPRLMVGFNRRFAPHIQKIKQLLKNTHEPKSFIVTVNAGAIPEEHWTQDPTRGGGRLIGEACHFVDLLRFLAGAPITHYHATKLGNVAIGDDKVTITLSFADGSWGTIHYLANGHSSFPKERVEVFSSGRILQLDNFRILRSYGWPECKRMRLWRQDKGQVACVQQFVEAITEGNPAPIPIDEIIEVSRVVLDLAKN